MKHTNWVCMPYGNRFEIQADKNGDARQTARLAVVEDLQAARLIAAAPELLEALRSASNALDDLGGVRDLPALLTGILGAKAGIDAAIAKAEGK